MSSRRYFLAAAACGIIAVISALLASATAGDLSSRLNDNFTATSATTYQCSADTPQQTADDIEARVGKAQARATDPADGTEYLRYRRNVVTVSGTGPDCTIRVEDLGRVNNGAFIFLGPGFAPAAPSGSSGGSSGSGGGVK